MEDFLTNGEVEPMLMNSQDESKTETSPEYEQYKTDMAELNNHQIMTFAEFKKKKCECQSEEVEPLLPNFN